MGMELIMATPKEHLTSGSGYWGGGPILGTPVLGPPFWVTIWTPQYRVGDA